MRWGARTQSTDAVVVTVTALGYVFAKDDFGAVTLGKKKAT